MTLRALPSARAFFGDLSLVLGEGRRRLPLLGLLIVVATALDLVGVALIAPFLMLVMGGAREIPAPLRALGMDSVTVLGLVLLVVFVVKGLASFRVQERIARITEGERARLMVRLLAAYQEKPYTYHLARNSTDLVNTVVWFTQAVSGGVLANFLRLLADGLVFLALVTYLAFADPRAVAVLALLMGIVFYGVTRLVRARLGRAVSQSAKLNAEVMRSVQQALGGLREVRLLGREGYFRDRLAKAAAGLVDSVAAQSSLTLAPRLTIEVVMVAFLVTLVWLAQAGAAGATAVVPALGTFAAAAVRLMPASTALLTAWNSLRANRFALRAVAQELRASAPPAAPAPRPPAEAERFAELDLDGVEFRYPDAPGPALHGVSLRIVAGEVVGLMGRSGSGKSTLADLVLGILDPDAGTLRVNGRPVAADRTRWQRMVAYIPQAVYLLDDTLRRNVAFGVPDADIDDARVRAALGGAQLSDFVARLPGGLDTVVGERGVRLSGGERQRLAIARALYHERQFLVLDEATSALDEETERAVVSAIGSLAGRVTMLVIAHRPSTLTAATRVLTMTDGRIAADLEAHSSR